MYPLRSIRHTVHLPSDPPDHVPRPPHTIEVVRQYDLHIKVPLLPVALPLRPSQRSVVSIHCDDLHAYRNLQHFAAPYSDDQRLGDCLWAAFVANFEGGVLGALACEVAIRRDAIPLGDAYLLGVAAGMASFACCAFVEQRRRIDLGRQQGAILAGLGLMAQQLASRSVQQQEHAVAFTGDLAAAALDVPQTARLGVVGYHLLKAFEIYSDREEEAQRHAAPKFFGRTLALLDNFLPAGDAGAVRKNT